MPKKCDQLEVIEGEMPTICRRDKVDGHQGFMLYDVVVPAGYKLLLKKAGVYGAIKEYTSLIFTRDYSQTFIGDVIRNLDVELVMGMRVSIIVGNESDIDNLECGGWVMFDFIPV